MKSCGNPKYLPLPDTSNMQGTYLFLSLVSGLVIKHRHLCELPAAELVISHIFELAANSGVPKKTLSL
jgi:hypothetical protein